MFGFFTFFPTLDFIMACSVVQFAPLNALVSMMSGRSRWHEMTKPEEGVGDTQLMFSSGWEKEFTLGVEL